MERPTLSVSQLNTYLGCPLKYRFQYVERLERPWRSVALGFGTAVHAAVEWFHRERMAARSPDEDAVLARFDTAWSAEVAAPLVYHDRETPEGLSEKGRAMLRCYLAATHGPAPLAVEQPFALALVDPQTGEPLELHFRGIIDLIEADGTLVDLKTAARGLEAGGLERHLQLSSYALCVLLQHGRIPPLRLDILLKTAKPRLDRLPTSRSLADLSWTARLIQRVAEAIETEHFFPNPSWRCSECEYFAHCQRWRGEELSGPQPRLARVMGEGVGDAVGC